MADPLSLVTAHLTELRDAEGEWLGGTVVDRGLLLARLRRLASTATSIAEEVEESLAADMEDDVVAVPGVVRLTREPVRSSSWKSDGAGARMRDDLVTAVAHEVSLDVATGEMDPMKRNVASQAMRVALEAIPSFSSLKQAGARRLNLYISDYRSFTTRSRVTVELPGGAE